MSYLEESFRGKELLRTVTDAYVFLECTDRLIADAREGKPITYPTPDELAVMRQTTVRTLREKPDLLQKGGRIIRLAMQQQMDWDQHGTPHSTLSIAPLVNALDALPYLNLNNVSANR